MGRLGVVAAPGRIWRPYAGPIAFLLAVTLVVAVVRNSMHHSAASPGKAGPATTVHHKTTARKAAATHKLYVVRAGDTITSIAARTRIPASTLLKLNPNVSPTALFIGQKIRLR
jgi:LysM repeat protein